MLTEQKQRTKNFPKAKHVKSIRGNSESERQLAIEAVKVPSFPLQAILHQLPAHKSKSDEGGDVLREPMCTRLQACAQPGPQMFMLALISGLLPKTTAKE